jgi:hypothetical protein
MKLLEESDKVQVQNIRPAAELISNANKLNPNATNQFTVTKNDYGRYGSISKSNEINKMFQETLNKGMNLIVVWFMSKNIKKYLYY